MIRISPSILSADFANLQRDLDRLSAAGADWAHVDVMDGHFVPNLTIGAPVVKALSRVSELPLDVHLMISDPYRYIEDFVLAGASFITIHAAVSYTHLDVYKRQPYHCSIIQIMI